MTRPLIIFYRKLNVPVAYASIVGYSRRNGSCDSYRIQITGGSFRTSCFGGETKNVIDILDKTVIRAFGATDLTRDWVNEE